MSGADDPLVTGRHLLGPHVVGQRIVVRRLVPGETGPTGGPAFTDLLGVCLSWSDGECVVQPEDGPAVTIPLALVVSGKPVPPRPSVRGRVPLAEAERRAALLGLGAAGDLRLGSVARVRRTLRTPSTAPVELAAGDERASASIGTGCDPVAEAQARVDGDWIGIGGLLVEPARRRQGLATALVAELLEWGAERGATTVCVRVPATDAAQAFCEHLGIATSPAS
jgi:GNAT superfamily N-acetyltransferase